MMRKQRLRAMQVLAAMGVLLASALLPFTHDLRFASSPAGAATPPQCRTSQLSISIAPSYTNVHTGNLNVNITFANIGHTCELRREVPGVETVVGAKHTPVGHDVVFMLPPLSPVVLKHAQSSVSVLSVVRSTARAYGCQPVPTDGLVISSGARGDSTRYYRYAIHGVCSSASHPNLIQGTFTKPVA